MELKKDQTAGIGVAFEEKAEDLGGKTVEGSEQCENCQRFMHLGQADFCFIQPGDFLAAAEIIGRVPGKCDLYLKAESPFGPALER